MKKIYIRICLFIIASSQAQTIQDSLYVWKAGQLVIKQSIKPADMDSITFKRPAVNLPHVTICNQVWATKNLDVATYSDGTPILQATNLTDWANLTVGAWCYFNNDPANNTVYGKLYNWYAVAGIYDAASLIDPTLRKNIAPTGWHVPTDSEWSTLINCLDPTANGGDNTNVAGGALKETGTTHWISPNTGATNSIGFTGLPGGYRNSGGTNAIGSQGQWWSSSEYSSTNAWVRILKCNNGDATRNNLNKLAGLSVRCIKN